MKGYFLPKPIEEICDSLEWQNHPVIHGAGVYKLIDQGRVVYVGMSHNLCARLAHHMSMRRFFFTDIEYARCKYMEAPYLERLVIKQFDPENNTKYSTRDRWKSNNVRRMESRWSKAVDKFVSQY